MLYLWHIMNLLTIPVAREGCLLSYCMALPLRWDGAEDIWRFGTTCEDRERGAAQQHFCSITSLLLEWRAKGYGKKTDPRGPKNLFFFWR